MGERSKSKGLCGWFLVLVLVACIVIAVVLTVKKKTNKHSLPQLGPVPGPHGVVDRQYGNALNLAMQFFDVQKSGKLVNNNISWRGDSAVDDGSDAKLDHLKGMYDAGDHMKFGFPMAFTATVLSWAILEYGDQMQTVNQFKPAQDSLKWITDYLINAHASDNVLYIHLGDPDIDNKCWDRPEVMTEKRPLTQVNTSSPRTDVAAETASINSTYSSSLPTYAQQLFSFADNYRGSYSESIPPVQNHYNSTGYGDNLLWVACWLYHAIGDQSYFDYVTGPNGKAFANWGNLTWFSWDNKLAGTQVYFNFL
ncbi:hypothetical protein ACSBR1_022731 [Camellia fascicularis]